MTFLTLLAITPDPFIVFTSNIFAILGLHALYFCLAALITRFRFLKPALILILAFIGIKLLLLATPPYFNDLGLTDSEFKSIKIDPIVSRVIVLGTLAAATVMSVLIPILGQREWALLELIGAGTVHRPAEARRRCRRQANDDHR